MIDIRAYGKDSEKTTDFTDQRLFTAATENNTALLLSVAPPPFMAPCNGDGSDRPPDLLANAGRAAVPEISSAPP
jgi:hypothetical protein